ncbi:class II myosin, partial [Coemansia thaxteri]
MLRTTRQGPSVASIRRAIQQGLDRPESPVPTMASLSSRSAPVVPDLFEQANVNFTDKKWVWVPHEKEGYIAGYVVKDEGPDSVVVHLMSGRDITVNIHDTVKVNPPKFEKVEDMADLGYLNEASVVHNLKQRYASNMIYTYSGLFLVAVNPYYNLHIYGQDYVAAYKNKKRSEVPPHIFAIADAAFHDMLHSKENQSILITGESGAGKTENTKKVIQYLTAIVGDHKPTSGTAVSGSSLEQQVLSANPILESFGNAQTIRNNNSSRFGKFIRIEFNFAGQIAGANIEWYLLEKPRVTNQSAQERNYHIFYQFMKGAEKSVKDKLLIDKGPEGYAFTKRCRQTIQGVDDRADFETLVSAMTTTGFRPEEQTDLFRIIAAILHLGNVQFQATRNDEAVLREQVAAEKLCHVLGIQLADFTRALLRPSIKAGKDWVTQSRTLQQVTYSVEALARSMYERMFGALVSRINAAMSRPDGKSTFIGVLDIAGFEILETNSFEQLCINYTNERLQQFFNRTMFVLEQEEYKREGIEWSFIDFGMDLQPTIDLIDRTKPIGIMSCLDEECVMPKATDKTFTEKLHGLWAGKSDKYDVPRFALGFVVKHYASQVEYSTEGWLEKNKDPLNENVTRLLGNSSEPFVAQLYADYADGSGSGPGGDIDSNAGGSGGARSRVATTLKRGAFRTVGQRHKDQLNMLMAQLNSTQPHFVRCILPNAEKRAGKIDTPLVLDQLRCNGVLEGIRITRQGFPNRVAFAEFRQRYEILAPNTIPRQVFVDSKQAASLLLSALKMDEAKYRLGYTKVFFRAGVLAELEEIRDVELSKIITQFQAVARGALSRSRFRRRIEQARAIRVIQRNARVYNELSEWPWWKLYRTVKPLLHVTRVDEEMRKKETRIADLETKARGEAEERRRLETERHDLERAKSDIEALLISERSAALDQEEILKRTQEREVVLEETLREHAARLEDLEDQGVQRDRELALRDVELAKMAAELEKANSELAQASLELAARSGTTERDLAEAARQQQQALEVKAAVEAEAAEYRQALERLEADYAEALARAGNAEGQMQRALTGSEAAAADLATRLAAAEQEQQRLVDANARLADEAAQLRQLADESADQGTRELEMRRVHEGEAAALRAALDGAAAELEAMRALQAQTEDARRRDGEQAWQERDAAEAQLLEHAARMEALEEANMRLEAQLTDAAEKSREIETQYVGTREIHDAAAQDLARALKTVAELQARLEEQEAMQDDYQQRITTQSQEYEDLKDKYDADAVARVHQLEEHAAQQTANMDDLRSG